MAVATYTSDLSDIYMFETTGGVSAYGGGGAGLGAGVDFAMEGTNAVDKQVTAAEKGFMYDNTANFSIGADDHFFLWIMGATPGVNDTRDNRGIVVAIGDDTSNFVKFHVDGSDTLPLGGGQVYAVRYVNTTLTNFRTLVGSPGTTPSWIGGGLNTTGTSKSPNLGVDGARIGTGYDILGGTTPNTAATFSGIAADDESTSEGIFQTQEGGYGLQGKLRIGSSSTECVFRDSNTLIIIKDTIHSLTDFTEILIENASTEFDLDTVTFLGIGTNNPGRFEMITSSADVSLASCIFQNFGETVLGTGGDFASCKWIGCGIITAGGADLSGSSIQGYEGTAGTSPLVWDVATNPNGYIDSMRFIKGTAATHAIEFGTTSPLTMTIQGNEFASYNSANAQNDSTFHFKRTSGTVTLNVIGGIGNLSYKSDGATIVIVPDPITTELTVKDATDFTVIQNARVALEAADAAGPLNYQESVTITSSGLTANATHTGHGLATDEWVRIEGANEEAYNGAYEITVTGVDNYTYTMTDTASSPATGTITSTTMIFNDLTDANGVVTDTRTYSADQNVTGRARKSSASPFYKNSPITATIDSSSGLTLTVLMIPDE